MAAAPHHCQVSTLIADQLKGLQQADKGRRESSEMQGFNWRDCFCD
jgi:hypothetical protein